MSCDGCHGKENPRPGAERWLNDEAANSERWDTFAKLSVADDRVGAKEVTQE